MRVLVCGGRDYTDRAALYAELSPSRRIFVRKIIAGSARGVDALAVEWA
jgi:hypothetical protein